MAAAATPSPGAFITANTKVGEKWKPPDHPLELEKALEFIAPLDSEKKKFSREFVKRQIEENLQGTGLFGTSSDAAKDARVIAWSFWASLQRLEEINGQIDKEFMVDFWGWLQGKVRGAQSACLSAIRDWTLTTPTRRGVGCPRRERTYRSTWTPS